MTPMSSSTRRLQPSSKIDTAKSAFAKSLSVDAANHAEWSRGAHGELFKEEARLLGELTVHVWLGFMDFEGVRIGGGAGSLVNIVKAFAGAGIVNRTVALFDNDTAARAG